MVKRLYFGDITHKHVKALTDINKRELLILGVLAILVIGFGVYPQPITELTHATTEQFLSHMAQTKIPAGF
jgi:NADH-quinone oxidoreductase subunit M